MLSLLRKEAIVRLLLLALRGGLLSVGSGMTKSSYRRSVGFVAKRRKATVLRLLSLRLLRARHGHDGWVEEGHLTSTAGVKGITLLYRLSVALRLLTTRVGTRSSSGHDLRKQ